MLTRQRTGRRFATFFALASILFQAVLFAWHVHSDSFPAPGAAFSVSDTGSAASGHPQKRRLPAPAKQTGDDCAICFALHFMGPSTLPGSPELPPLLAADNLAVPSEPLGLQPRPYLHFRTRAPPIALVERVSV